MNVGKMCKPKPRSEVELREIEIVSWTENKRKSRNTYSLF